MPAITSQTIAADLAPRLRDALESRKPDLLAQLSLLQRAEASVVWPVLMQWVPSVVALSVHTLGDYLKDKSAADLFAIAQAIASGPASADAELTPR